MKLTGLAKELWPPFGAGAPAAPAASDVKPWRFYERQATRRRRRSDFEPEPAECGDDIMSRGMTWLTGQLQAHMSQPVVYKRGNAAVALCATVGRTLMKLNDGDGGIRMEYSDRDFLIPTSTLVLGGTNVTPERGDLIKERKNGILYTYEVFPYGGEPPWRFSDPHRQMLRIHCKLIDQVP
jgi:hypothetical protein